MGFLFEVPSNPLYVPKELGILLIPVLWKGKLRLGEVKQGAQDRSQSW